MRDKTFERSEAIRAARAKVPPASVWRHQETLQAYVVADVALIIGDTLALSVVYRLASGDGPLWVRSFEEFTDGRFDRIPQHHDKENQT